MRDSKSCLLVFVLLMVSNIQVDLFKRTLKQESLNLSIRIQVHLHKVAETRKTELNLS